MILFVLFWFSFQSLAQTTWTLHRLEDGIKLYTTPAHENHLMMRVEGNILAPKDDILNALLDIPHRHKWVPLLESSKVLSRKSKSEFMAEDYFDAPWPISDRKLVLNIEVKRPSNTKIIIQGNGHLQPTDADFKGTPAVVKRFEIILTQQGRFLTTFSFLCDSNPNEDLPFWIVAYIQKKWPVEFLKWLRNRVYYPQNFNDRVKSS